MAAAIYNTAGGLRHLVLVPSMGGQLQGEGVDVANYPGLNNVTGPAVISAMRQQAAHFGAVFETTSSALMRRRDRTLEGIDKCNGRH